MRNRNMIFLALICVLCACAPAHRTSNLHDREYLLAIGRKLSDPTLAEQAQCGHILQLDNRLRKAGDVLYGTPEHMKKFPITEMHCKLSPDIKSDFPKLYAAVTVLSLMNSRNISHQKAIEEYAGMCTAMDKIIAHELKDRLMKNGRDDMYDFIFEIQEQCMPLYDKILELCR